MHWVGSGFIRSLELFRRSVSVTAFSRFFSQLLVHAGLRYGDGRDTLTSFGLSASFAFTRHGHFSPSLSERSGVFLVPGIWLFNLRGFFFFTPRGTSGCYGLAPQRLSMPSKGFLSHPMILQFTYLFFTHRHIGIRSIGVIAVCELNFNVTAPGDTCFP